jgi:hypothetical protein
MPGEEKLILYDVKSKHEGVSCRFACMPETKRSWTPTGSPNVLYVPLTEDLSFGQSKAWQEDSLCAQLQEHPV